MVSLRQATRTPEARAGGLWISHGTFLKFVIWTNENEFVTATTSRRSLRYATP
jgi:hypothetical protein